jgi:hypothetical protein
MRDRPDWLSLTVFILSILGVLLGLAASAGLFLITVMNLAMGDSVSALSVVWAASSLAAIALVGLPMIYWTGRKVLRGTDPVRARPPRAWAAVALIFPLAIAGGFLASDRGILPGLLGPIAQVLAAAIPAALIGLWARRLLPPITPTRAWGHVLMGAWLTPVLALAIELVLLFGVGIVLVIGLSAQPQMLDIITELGTDPTLSGERLNNALALLVLNPWTVANLLAYIAVLVPMAEEAIKTLGVIPFLRLPLTSGEAFLGGVLSGLGYALFEALMLPQPGSGWAETMVARVGATLMHAFTAGLTGWALAEAVIRRRVIPLLLAYPFAVIVHGLWNASAVSVGLVTLAAQADHHALTEMPYVAVAAGAGILLLTLTIGTLVGIPIFSRRTARVSLDPMALDQPSQPSI